MHHRFDSIIEDSVRPEDNVRIGALRSCPCSRADRVQDELDRTARNERPCRQRIRRAIMPVLSNELPGRGGCMAGSSGRAWSTVDLPANVPKPAGAYSPVIRAGDFIYVSGQIPRDPVTGEMGAGIESQTRGVMRNLERVLGYAGATLSDVVSVTAYLADIADWDAFNRVYREHLDEPVPTRTTVGAGLHGFLVEISAVAYRPGTDGP
jgi:2-iminobutanoate/2-iminopropanoate deaminase